ncbi:Lysophospholipid transporter LplT [Sinobacterium norvegicum]|uniref:Lysophospholipid transporter LplT n=1 Tax=Sinobacterium norvegicum TaxID=1641715 RepID=A0ABN8EJQ0_9GAMM|nr:MFS transporter [Sinobacterium norvegicum]CAH0991602.1 Lysophospholipid transporter LplT [Sinobacterium norvegicum]
MSGQFKLLSERRFLPLFVTQFLGAFNDNVYKNALIVLLVFQASSSQQGSLLVNLAAGLFILPFFLFSALSGQLADKYDKAVLTRIIKVAEVAIMVLASVALYTGEIWAMLLVLFLLGAQSTFFGPIKYSLLPQVLSEQELVAGNAQVEMGTFVAILLGTICGGLLAGQQQAVWLLSLVILAVSVTGLVASYWIPSAQASDPTLSIKANPLTESVKLVSSMRSNRPIFLSLLAVSWFWLLGAAYLTQLPALSKDYLSADNNVVTLLLCAFTIGVALGSLLCEKLSAGVIEIGLVPLGSLGLSLFGVDIYFAINSYDLLPVAGEFVTAGEFVAHPPSLRILFDVAMLGVFGGFYTVPLYAYIQSKADKDAKARTIAANNILNSIFMVASAVLAIVSLTLLPLTIADFFLLLSILNIIVALFIYGQVPDFTVRFIIWMLTHTVYRVSHKGLQNIPGEGAAIIAANHVSYVDALLLGGAVRRPIRFIMFKPIYDIPVLNYMFRVGKAVPIVSSHVDRPAYDKAMADIRAGLEQGDLFCIFPEGKLTTDGRMNEFKTGLQRIVETTPVPVIPVALSGLWGSFFSHRGGPALTTLPKRFYSRVEIAAEPAISPQALDVEALQQQVATMLTTSRLG